MRTYMAKSLALVIATAIIWPFAAYADAQSARVLAVRAGVNSIFQGKTEMLAVKMDVPIKATVKSDNTGRAQLMLPDDSTVSVAPDTEISLVEFVDTPEEENIVVNMATGTARFITGDASRRNPAAFTVNTPQASISIRGTMVTIQVIGDATKIYLNETSGKGVTVKNKNTGKEIRMRKPGMLITVEPEKMYERKAEEGEARDFNLALRGKFRPAALARAKAGGNLVRTADMSLAASGNLPVTTALNLSQMDQMNHTAQVANATLLNAPAVPGTPGNTPNVPATPSTPADTPSQIPNTPTSPVTPSQPAETPPVPSVPDAPAVPDTPVVNPVVPPVVEPPVENYTFTFAELAGTYVAQGPIEYFIPNWDSGDNSIIHNAEGRISINIPETYISVQDDASGKIWMITSQVTVPVYNHNDGTLENVTKVLDTGDVTSTGDVWTGGDQDGRFDIVTEGRLNPNGEGILYREVYNRDNNEVRGTVWMNPQISGTGSYIFGSPATNLPLVKQK